MKLAYIFAIGLAVSGKKHVLSRKRFLKAVTSLGKRMFGFMRFAEADCPDGFEGPCYEISSRKGEYGIGSSEFDKDLPYGIAVQYAAASKEEREQLMAVQATHAKIVTDGDPKCGPLLLGLKEMANALLGPSEVEMTKSMLDEFSHQFRDAIDIDVPNPLTGKSLFRYHKSHEELTKETSASSEGITFIAPRDNICVPVSLMIVLKCSFPKRRITLYNGKHRVTEVTSPKSYDDTLPLNTFTGRQSFPVSGCISEYLD